MKFLITIVLLAGWFSACAQTCIIVYVSNKGITAGADRKYRQRITNTDVATGKQVAKDDVYYARKIFAGNNGYWALSGADNNKTIHTICKTLVNRKGNLRSISGRLQSSLQASSAKNSMHELVMNSNEAQKNKFASNMTEIVFFNFEANVFKAYRIGVSMPGIRNGDERLHFDTDSIVASKRTVGMFVLGHHSAIPENSQLEKWTQPSERIRKLIRLQAKYTPDDVSAEADIIQLTKTGYNWVSNNKK